MTKSPEKFAILLTQAITQIESNHRWSKRKIQDYLGQAISKKNGYSIQQWRTGNKSPAKLTDVVGLAQHIIKLAPSLGRGWAEEFLASGGCPKSEISSLCEQFFPTSITPSLPQTNETHSFFDLLELPDVNNHQVVRHQIDTLHQWVIEEKCKLILVCGMQGQGKTTLVAQLIHRLLNQFDFIGWKSLHNAPPIDYLWNDWLAVLDSRYQPLTYSQGKEQRILSYLNQKRCLFVLDNLETLLHKKQDRTNFLSEYEPYEQFLQWVSKGNHQSCVIMTGREIPQNFSLWQNERVKILRLEGMSPEELKTIYLEQSTFFASIPWEKIMGLYGGNPLYTELAIQHVREFHQGNFVEFEQHNHAVDEIEYLLDQLCDRLSSLEYDVLIAIAINREPIELEELRLRLNPPPSKPALQTALITLVKRSLLKKTQEFYYMQHVILEYLTNKIVEKAVIEIESNQFQFLINHALLNTSNKEYILQAQKNRLLKPITIRLKEIFGFDNKLFSRLIQIVTDLNTKHSKENHYLVGNIINLLINLKFDFHGLNLSGLPIREVDWRGVSLVEVNLENCSLFDNIFNENIGQVVDLEFDPNGKFLTLCTHEKIVFFDINNVNNSFCFHKPHHRLSCISYSHSGTFLANGTYENEIHIWDISKQKLHQIILTTHYSKIEKLVFTYDDKYLVSCCSTDSKICFWDLETGQKIKTFNANSYVWAIGISKDDKYLFSGHKNGELCIWEIETEVFVCIQAHKYQIWDIVIHPTKQWFATAGEDAEIHLWDFNGNKIDTFIGHKRQKQHLIVSKDGKLLASTGYDQVLRIWDIESHTLVRQFGPDPALIGPLCCNLNYLYFGNQMGQVSFLNISNWSLIETIQGVSSRVRRIAFSPDGMELLTSHDNYNAQVWRIQNGIIQGKERLVVKGHQERVSSVAIQNALLATGSDDCTVRICDRETGRLLENLQFDCSIWNLHFNVSGNLLAISTASSVVYIYNLHQKSLEKIENGDRVWSIAFSSTDTILAASCENGSIKLWNTHNWTLKAHLNEQKSRILAIAIDPDSQYIASSCDDHSLNIWSLQTGEIEKKFEQISQNCSVNYVSFGKDGYIAMAQSNWIVGLFHWPSGTFKELKGHNNEIECVIFSPDFKTLVSSTCGGELIFWDVISCKPIHKMTIGYLYQGLNITGVEGLTEADRQKLIALGAFQKS